MKIWKNLFGKNDKIHVNEIAVAPGLLLGGAVIVESGSNERGRWVKYGDGTMECYCEILMPSHVNISAGSIFMSQNEKWRFPIPFVSRPVVKRDVNATTGSTWAGMGDDATTYMNCSVKVFSYKISGSELYKPVVSLTAIGRWK